MLPLSIRAVSAFSRYAVVTRNMTTSAGTKKLPLPPKRLRDLQEKFQVDDGIPVHLKGGLKDQVLFATTVLLGIVGMGMVLNNLYIMAFPRPVED